MAIVPLARAPYERETIQTPTWDQWLTKLVTAVNDIAAGGGTYDAGNLTGTTLAPNVVNSSLTSVGTLVNLTVTNPIAGSVTGASGSSPAGALTGATLAANVLASSLTSVGTLTGGATGTGFTVNFSTSTVVDLAGTWTPTDASGAGLALTTGSTTWVKIGTMVFASYHIVYPATVDGSAAMIGGLPFTVATTTNSVWGAFTSFTNAGVSFSLLAVTAATTAAVQGNAGALTNATLSTRTLRGVLVYRASA